MTKLDQIYDRLCREVPGLELRRDEPMARHTTFKVGGPATLMALPGTEEELLAAVRTALEEGITPLFVGNGSNLLVSDEGLDMLVIHTGGLRKVETGAAETQVVAETGASLAKTAGFAQRQGLAGMALSPRTPGTGGGGGCMAAGGRKCGLRGSRWGVQ